MPLSASIAELALVETLTRLTVPDFPDIDSANIKRTHLQNPPLEQTPAIHVIEGGLLPEGGNYARDNGCRTPWEQAVTLRLVLRSDIDTAGRDAIRLECLRRMSPMPAQQWTNGVVPKLGRMIPSSEVADNDAQILDIDLVLCFNAAPWALDEIAGE